MGLFLAALQKETSHILIVTSDARFVTPEIGFVTTCSVPLISDSLPQIKKYSYRSYTIFYLKLNMIYLPYTILNLN